MLAKAGPGRSTPAPGFNAFAPYSPPRGVVPDGWRPKRTRIAMDDASVLAASQAWSVSNGLINQGWTFMGYSGLSELAQVPEYRVISEILATAVTRKWIRFKAAGDEEEEVSDDKLERIKIIEDEIKRLKLRDCVRKMVEQDGFFGRSHLYLDTGDTKDRDELLSPIGDGTQRISKAKVNPRRPLKAFRVVEPIWTYPKDYNASDPLSDDWFNPTSWFVMAKEISSTRLLKLVSREVPDLLKPSYSFGGLSLSQMAKPYVDNWLVTRQSVTDLLKAFSVMVLSTNLMTSLQADGDQLFKRMELFNRFRDNKGIFLIDEEDEAFTNVSAPLSGLHELQAQAQEHMCTVSRTPAVELLGVQPAGFNASSEGEIRVWEDSCHSYQEANLRTPLQTAVNFIQLSKFGDVDPTIEFEFVPLRTMTEKEQAEVQKTKADTHQVYVDMGAVGADEVRKSVAESDDSPYPGLDADEMPEPVIEPGNIHEREEADAPPANEEPHEEAA